MIVWSEQVNSYKKSERLGLIIKPDCITMESDSNNT